MGYKWASLPGYCALNFKTVLLFILCSLYLLLLKFFLLFALSVVLRKVFRNILEKIHLV